jgi:heterocyst specific transport system permease protein
MRPRRIPVAWRQLASERLRLAAAVAGITFAAMLMLMQLGFREALLESATLVHDRLDADLVLISPLYQYLVEATSFPDRRLVQALGAEGVAAVAPVYVTLAKWRNPENGRAFLVALIGFDVRRPTLTMPDVRERLGALALPDAVLVDAASRPEIGPVAAWVRSGVPVVSEVNGRRVTVAGLFTLGTSFGVNGMILTSDLNFARMVPDRPIHMIDIGLIRLASGADPVQVRDHLRSILPPDVRVLTRQEFADAEQAYWLNTSPVGFIFDLGTTMGLIVGVVIVYQILYTDISDHLPEYATLKAMGFSDRRLVGIVFREAVILAVLGFVPGLLIAQGLYVMTRTQTNLPMLMTPARVLGVFALTVTMCVGSGALAARRLRSADPAEIF